jgi:nucleoside-diphosphate-sugar epimerase
VEEIMALHVIVGAGPIGTATAEQLIADGHRVRVITRSGSGPEVVERIAANATDAERLTELTRGAAAIYNCANPPYQRWPTDWPPLATALLTAAERTGAVLVAMSNLYGYGPVDVAMTEETPMRPTSFKTGIRARMWADMLAAHQAGRIRATEARGSDYIGPRAQSLMTELVLPAVKAGRAATVPADLDAPHSWTYTVDAGRLLAVLGTREDAWGRVWHVPTAPAVSIRAAATEYARLTGAPEPRLRRMPQLALRAGGLFSATARQFTKVAYQFDRPFRLDSSAAQKQFDLEPTSLTDALRSMA